MLLKSKPKSTGEATANLYEVSGGLWELVLIKDDGAATTPTRASSISDTISYIGDCLHTPIVLHTVADIVSERLAAMRTVAGSVVSTDVHFNEVGQNTFSFKPNGSDKIIAITIPDSEMSAGLEMSNRVLLLAGQDATITYEIRYATDGDESVRELCGIVGAAGTAVTSEAE